MFDLSGGIRLAADTDRPKLDLLARAAVANAEAIDRLRDLLDGHFPQLVQ